MHGAGTRATHPGTRRRRTVNQKYMLAQRRIPNLLKNDLPTNEKIPRTRYQRRVPDRVPGRDLRFTIHAMIRYVDNNTHGARETERLQALRTLRRNYILRKL